MTAMRSLVDIHVPWRWIAVLSALGVAAVASVGVASAATTAPSVRFSKIQYNAPGTDDRSNASLNGEWLRLTNMTGKSIGLKGWTVKDAAGHKYTFGTYTLPAYANAYVHTGKGTDGKPDSQHRYWQSGSYVWNNDGDTATLRNASGSTVHSCKWGSGSVTYCGTVMPKPPKSPAPTGIRITVSPPLLPSSVPAPTKHLPSITPIFSSGPPRSSSTSTVPSPPPPDPQESSTSSDPGPVPPTVSMDPDPEPDPTPPVTSSPAIPFSAEPVSGS